MDDIIIKDQVSSVFYTEKEMIVIMLDHFKEPALCCNLAKNGVLSIIDANTPALEFFGYTMDNLLKKDFYKILDFQSAPLTRQKISHWLGKDTWEASIVRKNGMKVQVEITAFRINPDDQTTTVFLFTDISVLKEMTLKINNFKQYFEISETAGKSGSWQYDLSVRKLWISSGLQKIMRLEPGDYTAADLPELRIQDYVRLFDHIPDSLILIGEVYETEFTINGEDENDLTFLRSYAEFNLMDCKINGFVQDISERRFLEIELNNAIDEAGRSNFQRRAFLTGMNSEIFSPINRIVGYSKFLIQKDLPSEQKSDYAWYINKSCDHLLNVVTKIRDISDIGDYREHQNHDHINPVDLLSEILISVIADADRKGIEISLDLSELPCDLAIISDEKKIVKVLTNLTDNALKYTIHGSVQLGCKINSSYLEFYVRDTGIGMSGVQQSFINELFDQSSINPFQYYGERGLGLVFSKYYIDLLGGSIWMESKTGFGSTFTFTVPLVNYASEVSDNSMPFINDILNDSKTVLLVDNLEINYFYVKSLLSSLDFNVLWAKDREEAIYLSLKRRVDIVIFDLNNSDTKVFETAKIIKKKRPELLVFAQSGNITDEDKKILLHSGFDDIIMKPIRKEEFLKIQSQF